MQSQVTINKDTLLIVENENEKLSSKEVTVRGRDDPIIDKEYTRHIMPHVRSKNNSKLNIANIGRSSNDLIHQ